MCTWSREISVAWMLFGTLCPGIQKCSRLNTIHIQGNLQQVFQQLSTAYQSLSHAALLGSKSGQLKFGLLKIATYQEPEIEIWIYEVQRGFDQRYSFLRDLEITHSFRLLENTQINILKNAKVL